MIDKQERYKRVYSFMKRNAHISYYLHNVYHTKWLHEHPELMKKFHRHDTFQKAKDDLKQAKIERIRLTKEVLQQMEEGIINNTTSGIWLSYKKSFERLPDLPDKSRQYVMTLETGEKFLVQRNYKKIKQRSGFLEKRKIIKIL